MPVSSPTQAQQTGSFCNEHTCIIKYTSDAGGEKPFGDNATGTLKGGPNNQTYTLNLDKNGKISGVDNLLPGKYTLAVNYIPDNPADGVFARNFH